MRPFQARFITLCQQLLALGVVVAFLVPASGVISLDVVDRLPGAPRAGAETSLPDAEAGTGREPLPTEQVRRQRDRAAQPQRPAPVAEVPTTTVDPQVTEVALTPTADGTEETEPTEPETPGSPAQSDQQSHEVLSEPQDVTGYGAVGVTWSGAEQVSDEDIALTVRTRTDGVWSAWGELEYHDEHGPDPSAPEGDTSRPGTDPLLVGHVDQVQVRARSTQALPADMQLAVIDPGASQDTETESAAIDTAKLAGDGSESTLETSEGEVALQAATFTPKPQIFSRAQWGADEGMRDKSSLRYYEVHAGFVHHTVNANDYSRAEVPGIIRSIYAYHTRSRGWSDVGYNFLVDRFGRIWEGRAGGVDRPVVGAHTLGYNDYSFAMSAIGNFETARPGSALVKAYGELFAWKLSLHGVDAASTSQKVGSRTFDAINGHRDAGQTACPGRYLYAKIPEIRAAAVAAQQGWSGRELETDLAGTEHPDLIVRRASDGRGFVIPTEGLTRFQKPVVSTGWADRRQAVISPDLTGDGRADLVTTAANGVAQVRPGDGTGQYGKPRRNVRAFRGHDLVTAVGDVTGDKRNDLVARRTSTGRVTLFQQARRGRYRAADLGVSVAGANALVGAGDVSGDGRADLMVRESSGGWTLRPGTGKSFGTARAVNNIWGGWRQVAGGGDLTGDGLADLAAVNRRGRISVLPGRGDGSFGSALGPGGRLRGATDLSVTQVAGSGHADVVGRVGDQVRLMTNAGTTELGTPINTGADFSGANLLLRAGDWDRDGYDDVIARVGGTLQLYRGNGSGRLSGPTRIGTGWERMRLVAAVGDMTGDGWPDLVGQPSRRSAMRIYPGRGTDGMAGSFVASSRIRAARQVAVGRWNADGAPDSLFLRRGTLTLRPGNGPGGFTGSGSVGRGDVSKYDWVLGVSDVQLNGHADLVVRERATGRLYLLNGRTGGLKGRRYLGEGMGAYNLAG